MGAGEGNLFSGTIASGGAEVFGLLEDVQIAS